MRMKVFDYHAVWQEKLADQLRRGSIYDVKMEERNGLYYVLGSYQNSDGLPVWDAYAYFSKPYMAEEALKTVKRLAALN